MITKENIDVVLKKNMGNYSFNINIMRSFPNVYDGLKPVARKVITSMYDLKITPGKPYRKVAAVVGDCLGHYYVHGDASIVDALVKMQQPFYMNSPLVDGQGNFGSISGDEASAMRYIECKMSKYCADNLEDIEKNAVDWKPNFDKTCKEPSLIPVKYPNLLINGSFGIGQAYISSIPPHNFNDIVDTAIKIIKNPNIELKEIAKTMKPDYPTGGIIINDNELEKAYTTGIGNVKIRARINVTKNNDLEIVEIPYMTTVGSILNKIQDVVKDGRIDGISDIIDQTNEKNGVKVLVKIKKGYDPKVVENQLYTYTPLQSTLNLNLIAVDGLSFKTFNVLELFTKWIEFRKNTLKRIFNFKMSKIRKRVHIIDGLLTCLNDIDNVIQIIKSANDKKDAQNKLTENYNLSEIQSEAIVDLQLYRLTGLSIQQLKDEKDTLTNELTDLSEYFTCTDKLNNYIINELEEGKSKFGKERKTECVTINTENMIEDSIPNTNHTIFITKDGFVKKLSLDVKTQNKGGKGRSVGKLKDKDYVLSAFSSNNKDNVLFFTNKGRLFTLKTYELKDTSMNSYGYLIDTYINLKPGEKVVTTLSLPDETYKNEDAFLIFVTEKGLIKRSLLSHYSSVNKSGLIALKLNEDDNLISVKECEEEYDVVIASANGMGTRFNSNEVTLTLRPAGGMKGINLVEGDRVVSFETLKGDSSHLLVIDSNGNGKRIELNSFQTQNRTNKAKIISKLKPNDELVVIEQVNEDDEITIVSTLKMIKLQVANVPVLIRSSSPKNIFKLNSKEKVLDAFID